MCSWYAVLVFMYVFLCCYAVMFYAVGRWDVFVKCVWGRVCMLGRVSRMCVVCGVGRMFL